MINLWDVFFIHGLPGHVPGRPLGDLIPYPVMMFPTMATGSTTSRDAGSRAAFERALGVMPGGVSSPVRAYQAVGGQPVVIRAGQGAWVTDVDGKRYIDYVCSYGPLILGHAPLPVLAALTAAAQRGTSFGAPTQAEATLAQMIIDAVESIELVRFVNSGTEATMSAIRLARAATGRDKIIKFAGCYHGHSDGLLVQAGSGATTLGVPSSPGVPASVTQHTLLAGFNDLTSVQALFQTHPDAIAAVIVEPIAGNMGCVLPVEGFLERLRQLCDRHGALLIFDEVMTGFRVAYGGAQALYGVKPDLTCLGKVIGGGLPCAAYGGRLDLMQQVAPQGPVYQAGTLSGNPLAMAAGIATLQALGQPGVYAQLEAATATLASGLQREADPAMIPLHCTHVGSMLCCFFAADPVTNYDQALGCDTQAFGAFFRHLLARGVMLPPSQFETWFVSTQHDAGCIDQTLQAAAEAFNAMA